MTTKAMNTYDPQTTQSDFIDGFAAGAELSRQSAFIAWLRFSTWMDAARHDGTVDKLRATEESKGFDNGVRLGRQYAGKPAEPVPMTAEQHNKYKTGRWT